MAHFLRANNTQYGEFSTSIAMASDTPYEIRVLFRRTSGTLDVPLFGSTAAANRVLIETDATSYPIARVNHTAGDTVFRNAANTVDIDTNPVLAVLTKNALNEVTLSVGGILFDETNINAAQMTPLFILRSMGVGDASKGSVDWYSMEVDINGVPAHRWDANSVNGNGLVIADEIGNNDITLIGYASATEPWVAYTPMATAWALDFQADDTKITIPNLPYCQFFEIELETDLSGESSTSRLLSYGGINIESGLGGLDIVASRSGNTVTSRMPDGDPTTAISDAKIRIESVALTGSSGGCTINLYVNNEFKLTADMPNSWSAAPDARFELGRQWGESRDGFSHKGKIKYFKFNGTDSAGTVHNLELINTISSTQTVWTDNTGNGYNGVLNGTAATAGTEWFEYSYPITAEPDTTAPVITLLGSASVTITEGDTYIDAGATAADDNDETVTVVTVNPVNSAIPDTYTVTYNATDSAGNAAVEVIRTVIVEAAATQSPSLTTNGNQSNIATGATVTLSVTATVPPERSVASIQWVQTLGTTVILTNATTSNATYTAPDLTVAANLTFTVTVTDDLGSSSTATVVHGISANTVVADLDLANAPLVNTIQLDYIGAFHSSDATSSTGVFCIAEDSNSFFTFTGARFLEVAMPNALNLETGYKDTYPCATLQDSGDIFTGDSGSYVFGRIDLGINGYYRPVGMLHKDGKLIVHYMNWYDTGTTNTTTFVFRDASNLATCPIDGPYGMELQSRQAGAMSHTPPNLLNFFGANILSGAPSESIVSRSDYGPSLRAFDTSELIEESRTAATFIPIGGESYMRYLFDTTETGNPYRGFVDRNDYAEFLLQNATVYSSSSSNIPLQKADGSFTTTNFFNQTARHICSFIIPNSKTLCAVVALRGSTAQPYYTEASVLPTNIPSGIGYKIRSWSYNPATNEYELSANESGGGTPYIQDDAVHRFYLFDLSDLESVKNGQLNPWEVQPYHYQDFKSPLQFTKTSGIGLHLTPRYAYFDYNDNVLYFSYQGMGGTGDFDYSSAIAAMDVNGLADRTRITDGSAPANRAPTVNVLVNAITVEAGDTITFTASASDIDGDTITYLWSSGETTQSISVVAPSEDTVTTVTRSCVVNDGNLNSIPSSVTVTVNPFNEFNTAPIAVISTPTTTVMGQTFTATSASTDVDNDVLTFLWSATNATLSSISTESVQVTPLTVGQVILTLIVNDGVENSNPVNQTITVTENNPPVTSVATVNVEGTPNGTYTVNFTNPTNGVLLERQSLSFSNGTATTTLNMAVGTAFNAHVFTATHIFGNVGVTI